MITTRSLGKLVVAFALGFSLLGFSSAYQSDDVLIGGGEQGGPPPPPPPVQVLACGGASTPGTTGGGTFCGSTASTSKAEARKAAAAVAATFIMLASNVDCASTCSGNTKCFGLVSGSGASGSASFGTPTYSGGPGAWTACYTIIGGDVSIKCLDC